MENELAIAFGGRVAEEIIFKRISTGAANDIKQATKLANRMIRSFGMSDDLALLSYEDHDDNIFIGREMTQAKGYSEATAQQIDAEVAKLVDNAYRKAKQILEENVDILHRLMELLIDKETVLGPELDDLIAEMRPEYDFTAVGTCALYRIRARLTVIRRMKTGRNARTIPMKPLQMTFRTILKMNPVARLLKRNSA